MSVTHGRRRLTRGRAAYSLQAMDESLYPLAGLTLCALGLIWSIHRDTRMLPKCLDMACKAHAVKGARRMQCHDQGEGQPVPSGKFRGRQIPRIDPSIVAVTDR